MSATAEAATMTRWRVSIEPGHPSGEDHYRSRLTWHDVELMRTLHDVHGMPVCEIARKWELPYTTVYSVCMYQTWRYRVTG